ncbi:MAG: site-specific integrase [Tyzzerella sp.]|nr:site-specific integrase [Tyzzerella sp.]
MKMPNGYGSITKLSGNRRKPFMVRLTDGRTVENGEVKLNRIVLGYYATRKDAMKALAEYNTNPYDLKQKGITFEEVYKMWSDKKYKKISEQSAVSYRAAFKHAVEIKDMPVREIKAVHMQNTIDNCPAGYQTKKALRSFYNQVFEFALENDLVEKSYTPFLDIGAKETVINRTVFSKDEINALWDALERMEYVDTILILIYSGMRVGELLEMQCCNVDISAKTMKIVRAKNKSSLRTVPIHDKILPLVEKHLNNSIALNCPTLLANQVGKPFTYSNYQQKRWTQIMEQLEMNHLPHDTRHTFASLADTAGLKKICIKRIMGHESKDITDKVYTHKDISELLEQINLIE